MDKEINKGKLHKILIITLIVILLLIAISGIIGYILYSKYQEKQEQILAEKIAKVDEVTTDNLNVKYNKEPTNENIEVTLSTLSENTITYLIEEDKIKTEYIQYNEPIIVNNNTKIYIKYMNSYGTYSQGTYIIEITNIDKELPIIVNKDVSVTTNSLSVNITAKDNVEVQKIEVSIDNENYNELKEGKYTFEGLKESTEYTVKIRVTDTAGNIAKDEITKKTDKTKLTTIINNNNNTSSNNTTSNAVDNYIYNISIDYLIPKAQENSSKYRSKAEEVLKAVNEYRLEVGAKPLTFDENLMKAAMVRALDISYGKTVAHTRPNGDNFANVLSHLGIYYPIYGENIVYNRSVAGGINWWRNSQGHYANMINELYTKIGVGVSYYNGYYYMVQLFGG